MKRAILIVALVFAAVACKPIVVQPSTQILAVSVSASEIGGKDGGYMNGQGDVLGVPGYDHCHTAPDLGWTNNETIQCQVDVPTGTTLTLTEIPDDATSTGRIGGDCESQTATTCTVKMDGTRRVYGTFFPIALLISTHCWPEARCAAATTVDSYHPNDEPVRYDFYDHFSDYSRRMVPGTRVIVAADVFPEFPGYEIQWGAPCTDIVVNNTCSLTINEFTHLSLYATGPQPE